MGLVITSHDWASVMTLGDRRTGHDCTPLECGGSADTSIRYNLLQRSADPLLFLVTGGALSLLLDSAWTQ